MPGGTWQQLAAATRGETIYWGASATPANTEAFIESLPGKLRTDGRVGVSFTVLADGAKKICFASPMHFGTPVFTAYGLSGGFILRATVSVTDSLGITAVYNLYESVAAGLGSTPLTITWP